MPVALPTDRDWILLFEAYKYTTVSVATLSYYFAPVIVMAGIVFGLDRLVGEFL
jgi:drug/metabolite transporter (DMT)-like permease